MGHHHTQLHHHNDTSDGVSQRVNSPRFSGPMTRRAHSFKRTNGNSHTSTTSTTSNNLSVHHEIDLQLSSPRSEVGAVVLVSIDGLSQRRGLLRKPSVGSMVLEFGLKERKKLGHWMFLVFCGVCLFLGVFKICATDWFGSAIETVT